MYKPVGYSEYLQLDKILNAQAQKSIEYKNPSHDEMLFIIIHQVYELWFKQILHEVGTVIDIFNKTPVPEQEVGIACARLDRVIQIQKILIDQIKVLETMTPLDFLEFRDYLTPASGFQSFQFRMLEIKLGLPTKQRLLYNNSSYSSRLTSIEAEKAQQAESEDSLLQLFDKWLCRIPFMQETNFEFFSEYKKSVLAMLENDKKTVKNNKLLNEDAKKMELKKIELIEKSSAAFFDSQNWEQLRQQGEKRLSHKAMIAALFICSYREQPVLQMPFRLITQLMDIDENMTTWRYRHAQMVQRMIGIKIGTGGSSGHDYLKSAVEKHRVFADLCDLSTLFIARSKLPQLPRTLVQKMQFSF